MRENSRIEREAGIRDEGTNKAVYVPAGAQFRAPSESTVVATVRTLSPVILEADAAFVVVEADQADNFSSVIGAIQHVYRPACSNSDPSPGKPPDYVYWN